MKKVRFSRRVSAVLTTISLAVPVVRAADSQVFSGDVGVGASDTEPALRSARSLTDPIPYLNFEAGPVFMRVDTLGVKTLPIGAGHIELIGQWRDDGYTAPGLARRADSVPFGIGTLQITPYGGFMVNALHDFGKSGGDLLQARYLAKFELGRTAIYPELGLEWQSSDYTRYYFAPRAGEGPAYRPSSAINPSVGMLTESHIVGPWYLNTYVRYTALDKTLTRSPLGVRDGQLSGLIALAYRF